MLIQAYDYQHLFRTLGCELQMGGADQWGNITAGLELIRRSTPPREDGAPLAYALAYPLLLAPSGAKFGKSESGDSVWLHPDGTSPYAFYQHWLNTDDRDVGDVPALVHDVLAGADRGARRGGRAAPGRREAQRALALDITSRVHGEPVARQAVAASEAAFSGAPIDDPAVLATLHRETGGFTFDAGGGASLLDVLVDAGIFPSRGEARRMIQNGGADRERRADRGRRRRHPAAGRAGVAGRPGREAEAAHRAPRWRVRSRRRLALSRTPEEVPPWEARFRAPRTLWVRMADRRPERAIACTNVTGVYQVHRWQVGEPVGEAMSAFPTGKSAAWISPDGEWVVWHADRAGDEVGHFVAVPWSGGEPIDLTPDLPGYASFAAGFGPDGTFGASIIGSDRVQLAVVPFPPGSAEPRLLDPGPGFVTGLAVGPCRRPGVLDDGRPGPPDDPAGDRQRHGRVAARARPRAGSDPGPGVQRHPAAWWPRRAGAAWSGRSSWNRTERLGSCRFRMWPETSTRCRSRTTGERCSSWAPIERWSGWSCSTSNARSCGRSRASPGICTAGAAAGTFLRADGKVVLTREDATMLPEVLLVDPANARVLETLIPTTPVPESRPLRSLDVPTTGGATAQGWLMTPDGPGPFPTILDIHGGPQGHELDRFDPEAQAWVDRGFAFFTVNYRGSTGFGREYEQAIWGQVGRSRAGRPRRRARDARRGRHRRSRPGRAQRRLVRWLSDAPRPRPRPDLWAAGVAYVAIADWRGLYEDGESLRDYQAALFGGTPDETPELHAEASPVTYVEQLSAPLLIIQGRNDARCPARQMEEYVGRASRLREGRHDRLVRCRARPRRHPDADRLVPAGHRVRRGEARDRGGAALASGAAVAGRGAVRPARARGPRRRGGRPGRGSGRSGGCSGRAGGRTGRFAG